MTLLDLLRLALATFWIAYVMTSTDGPFNIFKTLRARLPLGGLTACIICLSIWVAFALLFLPEVVVNGFATAGRRIGRLCVVWLEVSDAMNITCECIPIARYEETDHQWRPSVKILINGQFFQWIEYDLGFDEERFAMPYAREFAREECIRWERSTNQVLNAIRYE